MRNRFILDILMLTVFIFAELWMFFLMAVWLMYKYNFHWEGIIVAILWDTIYRPSDMGFIFAYPTTLVILILNFIIILFKDRLIFNRA